MKLLHTKAPSALNDPTKWDRYLKPWLDMESWQRRIDKRTGLNKNGQSIIKLAWAQDEWQHIFGEEVPRYWHHREKKNHRLVYFTIPRWVFQKRLERECYVDSWNATRYFYADEEGNTIDKGPAPDEYFTYMMECAVHEAPGSDGYPACCTRAFYTNRDRCWGRYRLPSQDDLDLIEQAVRRMESEKFVDPYAPLSYAQLAEIEIAANKQVERAEEMLEALGREIQKDFLKTYPYPGALSPGHFVDFGKESR